MSSQIHSAAVIEDGAEIGDGCRIGPFCHVGPHVKLGQGNVLHAGVVIDGRITLGDGNEIFPYACLGQITQDLKFDRQWVSYTKIGSGNVFREYVTVNASSFDGGTTVIGDNGVFLSYSHVAHDCVIGDDVIISSGVKLAGHVEIGDHAIVNGETGVIQFVRIGKYAFIGALNKVTKDILPYCIAEGFPSVVRAVNKIGLERNGFPPEKIRIIQDGFRTIIRSGLTLEEAVEKLRGKYGDVEEIQEMIEFATTSKTGLARPRKGGGEREGRS